MSSRDPDSPKFGCNLISVERVWALCKHINTGSTKWFDSFFQFHFQMQIYFFLKICNFVLHGIQFIVLVYSMHFLININKRVKVSPIKVNLKTFIVIFFLSFFQSCCPIIYVWRVHRLNSSKLLYQEQETDLTDSVFPTKRRNTEQQKTTF